MTVQPHPPELLAAWLRPFLADLTRPTWRNALILIAGAVLAPGRRTVAATLRVTGLGQAPTFTNYHRVLNRNRWSGRTAAKRLLCLLLFGRRLLRFFSSRRRLFLGIFHLALRKPQRRSRQHETTQQPDQFFHRGLLD